MYSLLTLAYQGLTLSVCRNQCQHCRLKKCFKMGLRREGESLPVPASRLIIVQFQPSSKVGVLRPLSLWLAFLSPEISPAGSLVAVPVPATSRPTSVS